MKKTTGAQIRAARALKRWTVQDLAQRATVGLSTVRRAELDDSVSSITPANLKLIRMALENEGIEFIEENGVGVGVRFKEQ